MLALADSSFIGGDANLGAGNLILGGTVNGDLKMGGGSIYLNSDVKGRCHPAQLRPNHFWAPTQRFRGIFGINPTKPSKSQKVWYAGKWSM